VPTSDDELKRLIDQAEMEIAAIKRDVAQAQEPSTLSLPAARSEAIDAPIAASTLKQRLKLLAAS
jgi:hypothetical protein